MDWILISSSLLKYLATDVQTNVFDFFHHFHLKSLKTEPALFPEALQTEADGLDTNLRDYLMTSSETF